jgi:hypothetical protein
MLEATEGEEPALPLHAVKRAVPPHGLADAGHVLHDERVDALGDGGLPRLRAGDVGLHAGASPSDCGSDARLRAFRGKPFPALGELDLLAFAAAGFLADTCVDLDAFAAGTTQRAG